MRPIATEGHALRDDSTAMTNEAQDADDERGKARSEEQDDCDEAQDLQPVVALALGTRPRFRHVHEAAHSRDDIAGDGDGVARFAARTDDDAWCAEHERPVGARRALLLVGRDERELVRIDFERRRERPARERQRRLTRQARTGARLGNRVRERAHAPIVGDRDTPFLCALDDVAVEFRIAHFPHRRREDRPHEAAVGVGTRLAPHELVPCPLPGLLARELHGREALPFGRQRHAARGERRVGGGDGVRPGKPQRRNVRAERRKHGPRTDARDTQHRQRALERARDPARGERVGDRAIVGVRAGAPRAIAQYVGQFRPAPGLPAAQDDDRERDERGDHDERLLRACARRVDQEERNRKEREVERRVQQDRGQQAEAQEDQRPHDRGRQQLDRPRIRREPRIVGVRAAEYERLQDHGERDAQRAMAVPCADQRAERKRYRAEDAFLHESRLQR
ncbi:MAG TPA: hypothetical protein VFL84_01315, partial [Gammaproteobacteria bacterium]|nr:hypothetical protein [Gammaproteobacteria bacterium]